MKPRMESLLFKQETEALEMIEDMKTLKKNDRSSCRVGFETVLIKMACTRRASPDISCYRESIEQ